MVQKLAAISSPIPEISITICLAPSPASPVCTALQNAVSYGNKWWKDKMWSIHTTGKYSVSKRKDVLTRAARQMTLNDRRLCEIICGLPVKATRVCCQTGSVLLMSADFNNKLTVRSHPRWGGISWAEVCIGAYYRKLIRNKEWGEMAESSIQEALNK